MKNSPRVVRGGAHARAVGCAVCEPLASASFSYMANYQVELSGSIEVRLEHASTGFCSMHTWYYAKVASPVFISSAYAVLAEARADQLEETGRHARDARQLNAAIAELEPSRAKCPACARIEEVERDALLELRATVSSDLATSSIPALCVHHTALLIASGIDLELGRRVVATSAALLRRRSEDMRTFALKREARRGLLDREEEAAYRDVLLRFAGDPRSSSGR